VNVQTGRRVGVGRAEISDVRHGIVYRDEGAYAGHPNRGGLWDFGGGEIAVAHLVKRVNYTSGEGVRSPYTHNYSTLPGSGVQITRSLDAGITWGEPGWVWHNDRSLEEILDWLRPRPAAEREPIDLGAPDAAIHFGSGEYLKFPFGGTSLLGREDAGPEHRFALGHGPLISFCLRSADRGKTWERHATLMEGHPPGTGFLCVNLGHARLPGGALGVVGSVNGRNAAGFYVSEDHGLSWSFLGEIARAPTPDPSHGFTYLGVHLLPDGRLMCSTLRMPDNIPHVAFSTDHGLSWSRPRAVVDPLGGIREPTGYRVACPPDNRQGPRFRSPRALVTRDGLIVMLFARRQYTGLGDRGICGVASADLGATWSEEFVVRGDQYTWDGGYPVLTELEDGRLFCAYYFTAPPDEEGMPDHACVRQIACTHFRVEFRG